MKLDEVLDKVSTIGAIGRREDAERAIAATVSVLAECLDDDDAVAVANDLPRPLKQLILTGRHGVVHDDSELYQRVCVREGAPPGFSREHAQAACEVIGSLLSLETRRRLEAHLPPSIVDLLRPVNRDSPAPPYSSHDRRHNVLATGSGDSEHPMSSAEPRDASGPRKPISEG